MKKIHDENVEKNNIVYIKTEEEIKKIIEGFYIIDKKNKESPTKFLRDNLIFFQYFEKFCKENEINFIKFLTEFLKYQEIFIKENSVNTIMNRINKKEIKDKKNGK